MLFVVADFVKINFLREKIRNTIKVSNSMDPDQARRFVGPDLGPNCLQRLSVDDTRSLRLNGSQIKKSDLLEAMYLCTASLKKKLSPRA